MPIEVPKQVEALQNPQNGPLPEASILDQPQTPPSTSEVIAAARMALQATSESLIRYGVMQKWEVDHLFGPIYQHLSER